MKGTWLIIIGFGCSFIAPTHEQFGPPNFHQQTAELLEEIKGNAQLVPLRWVSETEDQQCSREQEKLRNAQDLSLTSIFEAIFVTGLGNIEHTSKFPTAFTKANISEHCRKDSKTYYVNHILQKRWAQQMYQSTGQFPDGSAVLLYGRNAHATGSFDQCIDARYKGNDTSFNGQFCTVFFWLDQVNSSEIAEANDKKPSERDYFISIARIIQFITGALGGPKLKKPKEAGTRRNVAYIPSTDFCIPSSCSVQDIRSSVASFVGNRAVTLNSSNYLSIVTIASDDYCFTREEVNKAPDFDGPDIAVIVTLSFIAFLVVVATVHEGIRQHLNRPVHPTKDPLAIRALHCFSALNNGKKLLSTKTPSDNLSCLNGIRVLSTTWVVIGHVYAVSSNVPMYNFYALYQDTQEWQYQGIFNASVSVDTFFVMSGLLVAYLLLKDLDRTKGRFNILLFYVHRYLRLTPVYAIILGFIATLFYYLGVGPKWPIFNDNYRLACRWNWWNNLLYVNNYVLTYPAYCMGETWYLACDMQMFLVSPLFIYPLWRWWKAGMAWTMTTLAALMCGTIAIFVVWDLPMTAFNIRLSDLLNTHFNKDYYIMAWTRFPPYLLGIIFGWILYRTRATDLKLHKAVVFFGWILAVAAGLAVVYGGAPYLDVNVVPSDGVRVSYGTFHRVAWSFAVGWVIFACFKGYGGIVNTILSWKAFVPLARLTYVVYLVHLNYLALYFYRYRKPLYYDDLEQVQIILGVIVFVFMLSFVISVTVEASFLNLQKLLFAFAQPTPKQLDKKTVESCDEVKNELQVNMETK